MTPGGVHRQECCSAVSMPTDFRPDPIADYVEWADNRYNPGYFLGGRIPPYLKKASLGRRARRLAAIALAIETVISVAAGVMYLAAAPEGWPGLALVALVGITALQAAAVVAMWPSSARPRHRPHRHH